jgi:hypothetical protein
MAEKLPSAPPAIASLEGVQMAEKIFLMLNGIGLVFLLFVFVEFLKEGRRTGMVEVTRGSRACSTRDCGPDVVVAVLPPASEIARMRRRAVLQFSVAKAGLAENKLATKHMEQEQTSSQAGLGIR